MSTESSKRTCSQVKGASCTNPSRLPAVVCGKAFELRPMSGCDPSASALWAGRTESRLTVSQERKGFSQSSPKRARRKSLQADCIQLCAQAMALEEMRAIAIESGELYYINSRRRLTIPITGDLREATVKAARRFHEICRMGVLPPPKFDARCKSCSLNQICLPAVFERPTKITDYLAVAWDDHDSQ